MSTITVRCRECGEHEYEFYYDRPDLSVGYPGGYSAEFSEEQCPKCGLTAPSVEDAECGYLRQVEADYDDESNRRYSAWKERDEVEWESRR